MAVMYLDEQVYGFGGRILLPASLSGCAGNLFAALLGELLCAGRAALKATKPAEFYCGGVLLGGSCESLSASGSGWSSPVASATILAAASFSSSCGFLERLGIVRICLKQRVLSTLLWRPGQQVVCGPSKTHSARSPHGLTTMAALEYQT